MSSACAATATPISTTTAQIAIIKRDPYERLSFELMEKIFECLTPKEAASAAKTCRSWYFVLKKDKTSAPLVVGGARAIFGQAILQIPMMKFSPSLVAILTTHRALTTFPRFELETGIQDPTVLAAQFTAPLTVLHSSIVVHNPWRSSGEKIVIRFIAN